MKRDEPERSRSNLQRSAVGACALHNRQTTRDAPERGVPCESATGAGGDRGTAKQPSLPAHLSAMLPTVPAVPLTSKGWANKQAPSSRALRQSALGLLALSPILPLPDRQNREVDGGSLWAPLRRQLPL